MNEFFNKFFESDFNNIPASSKPKPLCMVKMMKALVRIHVASPAASLF